MVNPEGVSGGGGYSGESRGVQRGYSGESRGGQRGGGTVVNLEGVSGGGGTVVNPEGVSGGEVQW